MLAEVSGSDKQFRINIHQTFGSKTDLITGLEQIVKDMKEEKGCGLEPEWDIEVLDTSGECEDLHDGDFIEAAEFNEMPVTQLICAEAMLYAMVTQLWVNYHIHTNFPDVQDELSDELDAIIDMHEICLEEMITRGIPTPMREEVEESAFEQFLEN